MYQQLGDRMKLNYEKPYNFQLPWRMPIIVRLDGRNFHTYTKGMKRPFDDNFIANMKVLALHLCNEVSTTVFAYCQSDEISLLLHPYKKLDSEPFFRNEVQKIASVTAGLASSFFAVLANIQKKDVKLTHVVSFYQKMKYAIISYGDSLMLLVTLFGKLHKQSFPIKSYKVRIRKKCRR